MTETEGRAPDGPAAPCDPAIDVSVVIVNWNTRDLLEGCLRSVREQTKAGRQIIVVDNASTDGSAAMVAERFADVELIVNETNRGFAAANNQGLRIARGRTVLLLNPDTVVLDGAIDRMLAWLDAHPETGCVGCQVWEDARTIQATCFTDYGVGALLAMETGLHRVLPALFGGHLYAGWDRRSEREVDVVSGMFMLVPRKVVETVGLLDEAFFVYAEEADWCRRIRKAGWRCVFSPEARILHLDGGSKSTAQIKARMFVQMRKSKMIYLAKHSGPLGRAGGWAVFAGTSLMRLGLFGALKVLRGRADDAARARLAAAALRFHLTGREPTS